MPDALPSLATRLAAIASARDMWELRRLSRQAREQFAYLTEAVEEIHDAEFLRLRVIDPTYGERCEPEDYEWSREIHGDAA